MKQIFTLTSLLVIVALFSFGQNSGIEKVGKSSLEKKIYELKQNTIQQGQLRLFLNKKSLNETPGFNSVQAGSQRLDSYVTLDWNKTMNQWTNSTKSEFSYDNSNADVRNTQYSEYDWDEVTSQWNVNGITYYTYEANGDMVQTMDTEWQDDSEPWVADVKNVYSFNPDGSAKELLTYALSDITNDWQAVMKTEYSYNVNGQKTQEMVSVLFDETSTDWFAFSKIEYTYNDKGDLKEELNYSLDFTTLQMSLSGKTEYIFDGSANLAQIIEYEKDEFTQIMTGLWKSDFTLDASGNIATEIYSGWDENTGNWELESKDEYMYNNNHAFSDLILPVNLNEENRYLNHMITEFTEYAWDPISSEWTLDGKFIFNYSLKNSTSVNNLNSESLKIYPNPASDYIMIDRAGNNRQVDFELFDIHGNKLLNEKIVNSRKIILPEISKGVYFYKISTDGNSQSGKLLKN